MYIPPEETAITRGGVHRRPEAGHSASPGRGAAPPDGTGVPGDVVVPEPGGRPDRALGKPGSRPLGHGAETRPQDGVEHLHRAPQPHLGLIADHRAILAARHHDPVRGPQRAAGAGPAAPHGPART